MLCNPTSFYPGKIDDMVFFRDNNLEKADIMNHYNDLIAQCKYSEASEYISRQEGVFGFFADYFNLIENRIYNLQEYLLNKPPKKQPFIHFDQKCLVSAENMSIFSDADEAEPLDIIRLFSDDAASEALDVLQIFIGDNEDEAEAFIDIWEEEAEPPDSTIDTVWI